MTILLAYPAPPTPLSPADVIEALEAARGIIKTGWTKHTAFDAVTVHKPGGGVRGVPTYSLVAAITRASRTDRIRSAALMAARMALPSRFVGRTLEDFNDDRATYEGDVLWLLAGAKQLVGKAVTG